ncbi:MAG TPA: GNAT family N-acetyltransferase [Allosphingosinicella sp.]|nr:GNAT family N-acetyltransferase [Allosphingosinicella sp.]
MNAEDLAATDNSEAKRFEIRVGDDLAIADYSLRDGTILFSHTFVPDAIRGRGIGTALIRAGLRAARQRGLKVIPACPFFARHLAEHPEEQDLVHPDHRRAIGASGG